MLGSKVEVVHMNALQHDVESALVIFGQSQGFITKEDRKAALMNVEAVETCRRITYMVHAPQRRAPR
jgi:hypothetical protein